MSWKLEGSYFETCNGCNAAFSTSGFSWAA
jgi:hypothetical protein